MPHSATPKRRLAGIVRFATLAVALTFGAWLLAGPTSAAGAAGGGSCSGKKSCDRTAPSITIGDPSAGSTVAGTVAVSGTAGDNVAVASVAVAVDGGAWQPASGTSNWSWSWSTTALGNGSHTVSARATDTSGNTKSVAETVTVSNPVADTTAPSVAIGSPTASATVSGAWDVTGTASDNASVSSVAISIDGGAWQSAAGTGSWSWSWSTTAVPNGNHTVSARATDASGNTGVVSETVSVSNTTADTAAPTVSISSPASGATVTGTVSVTGSASDNTSVAGVEVSIDGAAWQPASGTAAWSYSWNSRGVPNGSHTLAARATDSSGNVTTTSEPVTVSNTSTAPDTQGSWVSPEGVTINVNSAGSWTIAQIYSILKANALDLDKIGPHLTINVQDQYTSQTQTNSTYYMGKYSSVSSTMWLQGVNSGFASRPDDILTHEYGHAWSMYWYYLGHNGDWSTYESARWTTSDGGLTLATDSRTNSSYSWQVTEIVADDYRLLFGSSLAISERPTHLNNQIPDPRNVTGLRDFLYNCWRTP